MTTPRTPLLPSRLLRRSSRRYLAGHPWLLALSVLGVALGVAVVVAIDLANASAERAFELSAETVTGRATHQVVGASGSLPDEVYRRVRVDLGVRESAPVVEGYGVALPASSAPDTTSRTLQLLGVDPLAEAPFRPYVGDGAVDLGAFMAREGTALLAAPTATALGLAPGDTLRLSVDGQARALEVIGLLEPEDERSAAAMDGLVITDIGTAQQLFRLPGRLSRLDLLLGGDAEAERVAEALPSGASLVRSSSRTETVEQMTRAFELNLTALSLLALVVGMFLIYNTTTFSVVQRRGLLGRLRAIGVTKREVFALVAGEAALVGVLGTSLGLVLGLILGQGLVKLVTQTINDLYFVLSVRGVSIPAWVLVKGGLLGLGTTLIAAYFPAREAATASPSTVLQRSEPEVAARARAPKLALGGLALAAVGALVLVASGTSIALSYVALLCVLLAFALAVPLAALAFVRLVRPIAGASLGLIGRMASGGIAQTLSRTAVAIAALSVALAATIGVGVMVDSFRGTVVTWLDNALRADVFISPPSLVFRRIDAALDPGFAELVQASDLAEAVAAGHRVAARLAGPEGELQDGDLFASTFPGSSEETFRFQEGDPDAAFEAFRRNEGMIVSEPFSNRFGVGVGDSVRVETDRGLRRFAVAGVYFDYGSDLGVAIVARTTFERYFDDRGVSTLAVYLKEGVDTEAAVDAFRALAPPGQEVVIRSNRTLREASMEVFDRTFVITNVLRLLAVLVAFIGVLTALMALALERAKELAVLRAIGLTPQQVRGYVTLQTALMGALAGLLSIPLGLILALVLVHVINKRSFGWTLQFEVSPGVLFSAFALAVLAAVLAGLYPAWAMSRTKPSDALRES